MSELAGPLRTINAINPISSSTGMPPSTHIRSGFDELVARADASTGSGFTDPRLRAERAHPPQFSKLALVRVEHELAGVSERGLEDDAFALTQHHGVGVVLPDERGPGAIDVEKHAVQVKAVQQIELRDVHEVDPHQ